MNAMDTLLDRFLPLLYPLCLLPIILLLWTGREGQKQSSTTPRGCRKLGLRAPSNLSDEYDAKYSRAPSSISGEERSTEPCRIKALFIYPIKSCAPVELDVADLSATGLTFDRLFCFAECIVPKSFPAGTPDSERKRPRWTFRTLRQQGYERLVHVRPEVWVPDPEYVQVHGISDPDLDGAVVISYPNLAHGSAWTRFFKKTGQSLRLIPREKSFKVPLNLPKNHPYPLETISIWQDTPLALDYGRHLPADLKAYLRIKDDIPFTLFRASPMHHREIHPKTPLPGTGDAQLPHQPAIAFPDSYPLHLLNLASVHDVAARVRHEIPRFSAKRFRANMVVTGPPAYDEDGWKRVRVHPRPSTQPPTQRSRQHETRDPSGEREDRTPAHPEPVDLHCDCHTTRCRLPNVDPETAIRHPKEPDNTLRSYRCIDPQHPYKAALGVQLIPAMPGLATTAGAEPADGEADGGGDKLKPGLRQMQLRVGDEIEVLMRRG